MWRKPWHLTEGLIIGGGLVVTGLLLQYAVGAVDWDLFAWPVNGIALALFVCVAAVLWLLAHGGMYAARWLSGADNAIAALCWVTLATLVMGLTRQVPAKAAAWTDNPLDAVGLTRMLGFWPLVLLYLWLAMSLALVVLRRCSTAWRWSNLPFLFLHLGLLVVLVCGTLGSADVRRLKMYVGPDSPEWRALDEQGRVVELPLAVELKEFTMEVHDDSLHTPRRYASDVDIMTRDGNRWHTVIEVNKPASVMGWKIYQYGYDTLPAAASATQDVSILELVRDPWLPAVYAGIAMLLAGAVCLLFMNPKNRNHDLDAV